MSAVLRFEEPFAPSVPLPRSSLATAGSLEVAIARRPEEVEQALRLRYRVFAQELGARLGSQAGIDRDFFDPYCHHLVVRDRSRDEVVGTYRLLMPEQARDVGLLYADREFHLARLNPIRDGLVELGRACVHPEYRNGAVIMLLWSGIGEFVSRFAHCRYLFGCVSVDTTDGGALAAGLYRRLLAAHLADEALRVWPRERLSLESIGASPVAPVPALMKGYLRAGAQLLGEPHRDEAFGCADFPMMLRLDRVSERYQRRFQQ